jgi:Family of unknown function (DUF5678)
MERMAAELLNDLMKRSSELSLSEKKRLASFLTEEVAGNNGAPPETRMRFNAPENHSQHREQYLAWLIAHREEYGGRYVALDGDRLVGSGDTIRQAATAASQNGCLQPFLVYVPRPEGEYWGGWI